jgi:hypothetical protein
MEIQIIDVPLNDSYCNPQIYLYSMCQGSTVHQMHIKTQALGTLNSSLLSVRQIAALMMIYIMEENPDP